MNWLRILLPVVVLLAGCSGDGDTPEPTAGASPTTATTATSPDATTAGTPSPTTATSEASEVSGDGPLADTRAQLAWYVSWLSEPELDADSYAQRFAQVFRDQVPLEQFLAIADQLGTIAPYRLGEVEESGPGLTARATGTDGTEIVVNISTDDDGRIDGLLVQPGEIPELEDPPATIEEAADRLMEFGEVNLLAAQVQAGGGPVECQPTVDVGADQAAPIGSAFKLWVLGAVVDAVEAGTLAWDDELTITADVKSLPSGVLQNRPDGASVTVREAAELMISISDNTATDLLIHTVGREAVEDAQARWGHSDPALNTPFVTTREMFALKTGPDEQQDVYLTAEQAQRREILDSLAEIPLEDIPVEAFLGDPVRPDELEWFASPADLCRVLGLLVAATDRPGLEPLEEILTANPGLPDEQGRWDQIAFKGGSEPGLVTMAWLVADSDGDRFALTGSVLDPQTSFDLGEPILLLGAARDLLGN